MSSAASLRAALKISATPDERQRFLDSLSDDEAARLGDDWSIWARPDQMPPPGDWTTWLVMGGRGAGKTRTGAEWVKAAALGRSPFFSAPVSPIALIGETHQDCRDVMVEGLSGLMSIHLTEDRPDWKPSLRRLEWPNGVVAQCFSSEDPDALRGPQFALAWGDEIAKWRHGAACWDMLQFALRIGQHPRQIATTTPRPVPLVKRLLADRRTVISRAATLANSANLAPGFLSTIVDRYQGTTLGRQELDGELIEDRADALFRRADIERLRVAAAPDLTRIVVAVDPPATSSARADACGIVAAGLGVDGIAYVLADSSLAQARPNDWAGRAIGLYHALAADCLVAEVNQGGEMVETIVRGLDPAVPVRSVRASRGKYLRAEPVAALYDQGRVRHAGTFPDLEDEMADFGRDGLTSGRSPDRLDALVWAVATLLLSPVAAPKVRGI